MPTESARDFTLAAFRGHLRAGVRRPRRARIAHRRRAGLVGSSPAGPSAGSAGPPGADAPVSRPRSAPGTPALGLGDCCLDVDVQVRQRSMVVISGSHVGPHVGQDVLRASSVDGLMNCIRGTRRMAALALAVSERGSRASRFQQSLLLGLQIRLLLLQIRQSSDAVASSLLSCST